MRLHPSFSATIDAIAAFVSRFDYVSDSAGMRHTISVNLSILKAELPELLEIADQSVSSQSVMDAKVLLSMSAATALTTETRLRVAAYAELQEILTALFQAMSQATRARRLLNACVPHPRLEA
jgi:hypothetical protein